MDDFALALLFGGGVIVIFAWDQFNRPSYKASADLTRLIELLTPSRMRRGTVYLRAYLFYAGILLLLYLVICIYSAFLLPVLGLELPGQGGAAEAVGATAVPLGAAAQETSGFEAATLSSQIAAADGADSGKDPTIPLLISLVMVGLAPSVPILQRLEEKIRFAAHRLSGIPTRLIAGTQRLRIAGIGLGDGRDTLLIAPQDWKRLERYDAAAAEWIDDTGALRGDLEKIFAFRAWILQEKLNFGGHNARAQIAALETETARRIERLIFTLDTLSGFEGATAATEGRGPEQTRAAWDASAREADGACADLCVLLMLYVEHGVLPTEEDGDRAEWNAEDPPDATRQRLLAERKLIRYLGQAMRWVDLENLSVTLWSRSLGAVMAIAFVYAFAFARDSVEAGQSLAGGGRIVLAALVVGSTGLAYGLALLLAILWHQSACHAGTWRNPFLNNWARWLPQLAGLAAFSGLVAVVARVGWNLYTTTAAVGWDAVAANLPRVLRYAIEYESPGALPAIVLSVAVILITDAWRAGEAGRAWLDGLPWATGAAMFLAGAGAQMLISRVGALSRGGGFDPWTPGTLWAAGSAGGLAALIGLAASHFVRATLVNEFPRLSGEAAPGARPAARPAE